MLLEDPRRPGNQGGTDLWSSILTIVMKRRLRGRRRKVRRLTADLGAFAYLSRTTWSVVSEERRL